MGGRYRKNLSKGQNVAIVLKEDQRSGKLTLGKIANLLSPGEFHPRGIKVRLANNQIGRVQKILPAFEEDKICILVIFNDSREIYCRKLVTESGAEFYSIGIDKKVEDSFFEIAEFVKTTIGINNYNLHYAEFNPNLICKQIQKIVETKIDIANKSILIDSYLLTSNDVNDQELSYWDWCGWIDLETLSKTVNLSPESELILQQIIKSNL